jgi:hypothetical protein
VDLVEDGSPYGDACGHERGDTFCVHDARGDSKNLLSVLEEGESMSRKPEKILSQPETKPISQEQLVNEVKGIYAGLVMVEKKCVEICQQQSQTTNKLSNEQWQALIALHRTLLHEHHDFFLASQHPTASPALRRLASKYNMPARMWRHGIHSFLELLRHRLPDSLEHMFSFVYLAYQMMGLLMESVPTFHETWIECLGDLARYRMAIEEADVRDRENWSGVARMWYNRAAQLSPTAGRIQHHLAVLARPNIISQLFYYSKALLNVIPFQNAQDSIKLLFSPIMDNAESRNQKHLKAEISLARTVGAIYGYGLKMTQFVAELDSHITRSSSNWKVQGAEVASSLIAPMIDFGYDDNFLSKAFEANNARIKGSHQGEKLQDQTSESVPTEEPQPTKGIHQKIQHNLPINTHDFPHGASNVHTVWSTMISVVAGKVGDRNMFFSVLLWMSCGAYRTFTMP